jgi:dihydroneopterin aldolase
MVRMVMSKKHRLLEHVGHEIIDAIRFKFNSIKKVTVEVSKFNPPIGGVCHRAKVKLEESF